MSITQPTGDFFPQQRFLKVPLLSLSGSDYKWTHGLDEDINTQVNSYTDFRISIDLSPNDHQKPTIFNVLLSDMRQETKPDLTEFSALKTFEIPVEPFEPNEIFDRFCGQGSLTEPFVPYARRFRIPDQNKEEWVNASIYGAIGEYVTEMLVIFDRTGADLLVQGLKVALNISYIVNIYRR